MMCFPELFWAASSKQLTRHYGKHVDELKSQL